MTITELTPRRKDKEPVQRFEVFTGTGRRREWGDDEKRQIIEESYSSELSVCAVARRHGVIVLATLCLAPRGAGTSTRPCRVFANVRSSNCHVSGCTKQD